MEKGVNTIASLATAGLMIANPLNVDANKLPNLDNETEKTKKDIAENMSDKKTEDVYSPFSDENIGKHTDKTNISEDVEGQKPNPVWEALLQVKNLKELSVFFKDLGTNSANFNDFLKNYNTSQGEYKNTIDERKEILKKRDKIKKKYYKKLDNYRQDFRKKHADKNKTKKLKKNKLEVDKIKKEYEALNFQFDKINSHINELKKNQKTNYANMVSRILFGLGKKSYYIISPIQQIIKYTHNRTIITLSRQGIHENNIKPNDLIKKKTISNNTKYNKNTEDEIEINKMMQKNGRLGLYHNGIWKLDKIKLDLKIKNTYKKRIQQEFDSNISNADLYELIKTILLDAEEYSKKHSKE